MSAEGLSPSASLEQPVSPEGIVIHAIVPDRSGSHILTVDGQIPSELHLPGQRTYEQTLAHIGFWAANLYLSPDIRIVPVRAGITYLTKPIPDETELSNRSSWEKVPDDELDPAPPKKQRIVRHGILLLSLR